jgi:2-oxo-4-hydroxy-4-carboxy-5-ureidoimidazoline decarboxylase
MSAILRSWNRLASDAAAAIILPCCSSHAWADTLARSRPLLQETELLATSDAIWMKLERKDWDEAFSSHPRIGEKKIPVSATKVSADGSLHEQSGVTDSDQNVQEQLKRGNTAYEEKFGRTYIVCATGKSAEQMLTILLRRLKNDEEQELREAVEQQRQITQLRLKKWLQL